MTKEELVALAAKVKEGKASPEEKAKLIAELNAALTDLNKELSAIAS